MLRHLLLFAGVTASAANITLQGSFTQDDGIQLFNIVVAPSGSLDVRTYGYAGGMTSTGAVVTRGGFDPVLTLFDTAGNFIADNDDGFGVGIDPITDQASDARITMNLAAGSYILALTQYDNFSGGDLADGFVESGHPNFTAAPNFTVGGACPGNLFRDTSGTSGGCRDGNWTVDFVNVASVTERIPSSVPEPATILLLGFSLVGLGVTLATRRLVQRSVEN